MTIYDEVPYPSYSFEQTHPDRLAAVATLFGLSPPAISRARVLELGCAAGGNLLPMALGLPDARFVGIDLSQREIAEGQVALREHGVTNLQLLAMDITAIPPGFGTFDYILAHGLYSWVPRPVQDKLLDLLRDHLSPDGIAYVSYNAMPGWHVCLPARELVLRHTRHLQGPQERLARARELLERAGRMTREAWFKEECKELLTAPDPLLLHDLMAEHNEPLRLTEFLARAQSRGLHFLADGDLRDIAALHPESGPLHGVGLDAVVEREQLWDELRGRRFRRTLLCRKPAPQPGAVAMEGMARLWFTSLLRPESAQAAADGKQVFARADGARLTIDSPLARAALLILARETPRAVAFAELFAEARSRAGSRPRPEQDLAELAELLVPCLTAGLVRCHTCPTKVAREAGTHPVTMATIRTQARTGRIVANLWHQMIDLEREDARLLLTLLDGTRDHAALERELTALLAGIAPGESLPARLTISELLAGLTRSALLVG